jgi:hypothetical protein
MVTMIEFPKVGGDRCFSAGANIRMMQRVSPD